MPTSSLKKKPLNFKYALDDDDDALKRVVVQKDIGIIIDSRLTRAPC